MRRLSKEEKMQRGTYRSDRDKNTPQFAPGAVCPKYLSKEAKAEWRRVAPLLEGAGILQAIDQTLLASYCSLYGFLREAEADIQQNGLVIFVSSQTRTGSTTKPIQNPSVRTAIQLQRALVATGTKLGMTPLDRSRVEVPPAPDEDDPLQRFIDGKAPFGDSD
jgi:P27 family predicted phage terminase small subunit